MNIRSLKKITMLLLAGAFSMYQALGQGRTALSGTGANTCGAGAGAVNSFNTSAGCAAGSALTTGTQNTLLGTGAGAVNLWTGSNNTFIGRMAGQQANSSNNATLVGWWAGAVGASTDLTALGSEAGSSAYDGNTILGTRAYYYGSYYGLQNVITGLEAGYYTYYTSGGGGSNSIYGYQAGKGVTSNSNSSNSFFGNQAGYGVTTGSNGTFLGYKAGYSITSGNYNTFVGYSAGYSTTTATANVFVGTQAGYWNTGSYNVFVGQGAGVNNTTSTANSYLGYTAGYVATGANNTFIGFQANYNTSTGGSNTSLGWRAGYTNTTGSNNTYVGYSADASVNNLTNSTAIGNGASVNASDKVRIGNTGVTVIEGQVAYTWPSDARFKYNVNEDVKGLEFIEKLRPVNYNFDTKKFDEFLSHNIPDNMPDSVKEKYVSSNDYVHSSKIIHTGFIAQEVEKAAKDCNFKTDIVHVPAHQNDNYGLAYGELVVPLVKAVQEQQKIIQQQEKAGEDQYKMIDNLKTEIATLQAKGNVATAIHNIELANNAVLFQNAPNPFGDGTTIKYFVPDNSQAQIVFYDESGNKVKEYKVEEKGMGQLNVDVMNLAHGLYSYSLLVNGKVVDTKKMIREE